MQEVALNENCWIYLAQLKPLEMSVFGVMLYDVEGYMNQRSEEIAQPDPAFLYPVDFKRVSPHHAMVLHRFFEPQPSALDQIDRHTLRHLMAKKAKDPFDVIFAYRALFPGSIGLIEVDYKRNLIDVLKEFTFRILPQLKKVGDLLETVSHCPDIPGAPSWTLNIVGSGHVWNASQYFGVWRASSIVDDPGSRNTKRMMTHRVSLDMETLHVKGSIVDRVVLVSDEFPNYLLVNQATWHERVRDILIEWRNRIQKALTVEFEESLTKILFATTIANEEMSDEISQTFRFEKVYLPFPIKL